MNEALSLHQRIRAEVEARILSGEWPPGHRIPFEHELTAYYGCSRMTVSKALGDLADAGLIERRRKAGSFVRRPATQSAVLEIRDIAEEVTALGRVYAYALLRRAERTAQGVVAAQLGVDPGTPILAVRARHDADGRPFCVEERLIHLAAAPGAAKEPFTTASPGAWLIATIPWTAAEHRIRAEAAGTAGRTLGLPANTPSLVVERRTFLGNLPVTHVRLIYPGAAHELVARFRPSREG